MYKIKPYCTVKLTTSSRTELQWLLSIAQPGAVGIPAHEKVWTWERKGVYIMVSIFDHATAVSYKLKFNTHDTN